MRALAKRSLACLAMLYFVAGLPHLAVSQRLERPDANPASTKPTAAKEGVPSPYGRLAPITQPYKPPTPRQLDTLIAFPALPLSTFATTPYAAPDRFRPPPAPPPQAWTPPPPPVPPPGGASRGAADSRHKPRAITVARRPQAPPRPRGAPVTMPSLLEPTWH